LHLVSFPTRRSSDLGYIDSTAAHGSIGVFAAGYRWDCSDTSRDERPDVGRTVIWLDGFIRGVFAGHARSIRARSSTCRISAITRSEEHTSELQSRFD